MKFKLRWWMTPGRTFHGSKYYAPLSNGDSYIPAFYIEKQKNVFKFIEVRLVHVAIKEQYIEVFEENGNEDGYTGGDYDLEKCNELVNSSKNYKKSIISLFTNCR